MVKIAVIGAGINGLACAVQIKNKYKNYQVTLISNEFSPNITSDGAGGLWYPYLCRNTPTHLIDKWAGETLEYLRKLWATGEVNICLVPIYDLYTNENNFTTPSWSKFVYGYMELNSKQLEYINDRYSSKYVAGLVFTTFVVPTTVLLAYLKQKFLEANGEIIQATVTALKDEKLKEFDIVINCTGLGAETIVPYEKMVPMRGQIVRVKAPWLNEVVMIDTSHYIIPNVEVCILGGTRQECYNTELDQKDLEHIMNGCKKIIPGLEHAQTVNHWVGLRPGRDCVRLEPEYIDGKLYIHNYGHGGSGFTLFWGCSNDVLKILEHHLGRNITSRTSKL